MPIERVVYSINEVNRYVKNLINQDEHLKYIFVKGEISNFKQGANGHLYFSLKDSEALISAAMFNSYASKLMFLPKNGDEVVVLASVDVYPTKGTYQLIVYQMEEVGKGAILVELEKLKKQLLQEGLFDPSRKRPINLYPKAIGVITAINGAAIKDIVTNIKRRFPICDIYVFPSQVQGENAPKELLKAFLMSQQYDLDTLIIGRGGGASEDLSAFNDEKLVRAIATSKMPVIAAIGHEIDSTLVDYVADRRASTPTGAAELATIDQREIQQKLAYAMEDMKESILSQLEDIRLRIDEFKEDCKKMLLDKIEYLQDKISSKKETLAALNPEEIMKRGYSIILDKSGNIIKSVDLVELGSDIEVKMCDGQVIASVKEKRKK